MKTFYAKSASKVLELFPWFSIWFDVNAFANSSMIIRWIQMSSVSFQAGFEMSEDGKNRASSVAYDLTAKLEDQGGFEILEDRKNRSSSVANDPTDGWKTKESSKNLENGKNRASYVANCPNDGWKISSS